MTQRKFKLDLLIILFGFAAFLLCSLWLGVWFQLNEEYRNLERDHLNKNQALARTFAEHCVHVLRQADHASHLYQELYVRTGGKLSLSEFLNENIELRRVLGSDVDARIRILDTGGAVIDSSAPEDQRQSFSAHSFFQQHASRPSTSMLVNTPTQQHTSWVIQMSRRLQKPDGSFGGVIAVQIDPINLVDQYDYNELGKEGMLMLRNSHGLAVQRIGHGLQRRSNVRINHQISADGQERLLLTSNDGQARLFSMRDLPEFMVQAIVGLPQEAMLSKYRSYRQIYIGYAGLVSFLIIFGAVLLTHQTRRMRSSMRAAKKAEAILSAAAEGSLDAFYILRCERNAQDEITDFRITNVNLRGARLLGVPRKRLIGQKLCEVLPQFRAAGYFANYVKVVQTGAALEEEYEIDIPQISARWLHHQIVTIGDGVAITVRDISARKQAELETRNNRNFLQSLIDYLPVLVSVTKLEPGPSGLQATALVTWNRTAAQLSGFPATEVLNRPCIEAFPAATAQGMREREEKFLQLYAELGPGAEMDREENLVRSDGTVCYLRTISVPILGENGQANYLLCIGEDISLRRAHELQLRKNQAEMQAVNDASPLGLVGADKFGWCTYVNRTFEDIAGISREQALGDGWMQAIYQPDRNQIFKAFDFLIETQKSYQGVLRFAHADGRLVWASVKIAAVRVDDKVEGYVGSVDDITQRREAELALQESEARLRTITNTMPAMVAYIDAQERYRFHNQAYEREIGIDMRNSDGKTVLEVVGPKRYQVIAPYIRRALAGEVVTYEDDLSQNGVYRVLEANYIPQFAQDGVTVIGFHVMRQDITAKKIEEQRLLQLAQLDVLTGLSNRAGFMQKLRDAMERSRQHASLLALMYMDIDHFKSVNDTYGHHTGDLLLTAFAQRLCHSLRASDSVARLGGDEFTVVMENVMRSQDAQGVAEKIVQAMRQPFVLEQQTLNISTSIGIAFFLGGDSSAEALINQADMMLYQSKRNGRNTWRAAPFGLITPMTKDGAQERG